MTLTLGCHDPDLPRSDVNSLFAGLGAVSGNPDGACLVDATGGWSTVSRARPTHLPIRPAPGELSCTQTTPAWRARAVRSGHRTVSDMRNPGTVSYTLLQEADFALDPAMARHMAEHRQAAISRFGEAG